MPDATPLLLRADALDFAYPGGRPAVRGVSLSLAPGKVLSLLGPNGSGKSTLIKLLLGYLVPSGGTVTWFDKPLVGWKPRDLARRVAYLPQAPSANPGDTVRDVLRLGRAPYWGPFGVESARDAEVLNEVASLLELTDLLERPMDHLSGGQRQRAFLGRCLVQQPQALLLDEPNTFLDLRHQVDLLRLLRELATTRGLAVLMSLHDLNLAGAFSDRVLLLDNGGLAGSGAPGEILTPVLLSRVYGLPMVEVGGRVFPHLKYPG